MTLARPSWWPRDLPWFWGHTPIPPRPVKPPAPAPAPPQPARFAISVTNEVSTIMALQLRVLAHLPALPTTHHVAVQRLTLTVNGTARQPVPYAPEVTDPDLGLFDVGDELSASLVHIDGGGNESPPRVATLTVADTIPPPQPGEFGLTVTEEVMTPDTPALGPGPHPEPGPAPEPAPAPDVAPAEPDAQQAPPPEG